MLNKYATHELTKHEDDVSTVVRNYVSEVDAYIQSNITDCREKSIALTKLEEASMWANKAIAFNSIRRQQHDNHT